MSPAKTPLRTNKHMYGFASLRVEIQFVCLGVGGRENWAHNDWWVVGGCVAVWVTNWSKSGRNREKSNSATNQNADGSHAHSTTDSIHGQWSWDPFYIVWQCRSRKCTFALVTKGSAYTGHSWDELSRETVYNTPIVTTLEQRKKSWDFSISLLNTRSIQSDKNG